MVRSSPKWIGLRPVHAESLSRQPLLPGSATSELHRAIGRLRWRLGLELTAQALVRGAIASGLALIVLALCVWFTAAESAWLWLSLSAAPLLATVGFALGHWPSRFRTAVVAD